MNFIEAAKKARAASDVTPAFTEPALAQTRIPPASETKKGSGDSPVPKNGGCFDCGYYDGKGNGWPGMCRFFETIGESAKEIDFTVVDPLTGCKCFMARSVDAKADSLCLICEKPLNQNGGDCWHRAFHELTQKGDI
jgi:hypothetical protein